jgi:hypothetical protein
LMLFLFCFDELRRGLRGGVRGDRQKFFPEVDAVHHAALCRYFNVDSAAMMRLPG